VVNKDLVFLTEDFNEDGVIDTEDLEILTWDWLDSGFWP